MYAMIPEVCYVIYDALCVTYLSIPQNDDWIQVADQFEQLWNFPNCLGAIDTCQIKIAKPPHSGSLFYNYNHDYTMGFMASCDAIKRFTWVNVGSYGQFFTILETQMSNCSL